MASHLLSNRLRLGRLVIAVVFGISGLAIHAQDPPPKSPPDEPAEDEEKPAPPKLTAEEVNRLIDDLSSDDFATRELAQRKLSAVTVADGLAELMRQRFIESDNPEVKLRLRRVLYAVAKAEFMGRPKAFLGIQMQDSIVIGGKTGREMVLSVMVLSVIPDSAAKASGIQPGDHIMSVDGRGFEAVPSTEFKGMIGSRAAGEVVKFRLRRGGAESDKKVKLGEMPADLVLATTQSEVAFEAYFLHWLKEGGRIERP